MSVKMLLYTHYVWHVIVGEVQRVLWAATICMTLTGHVPQILDMCSKKLLCNEKQIAVYVCMCVNFAIVCGYITVTLLCFPLTNLLPTVM